MIQEIDTTKIVNISCSNRPRNIRIIYACFLLLVRTGFVPSKVPNKSYKELSFRSHIGAGIIDSNVEDEENLLAYFEELQKCYW